MAKQLTKPTYEELAEAVLMFYNNESYDLSVKVEEALNDCGERLEAYT